jgi:hypothetical protein
VSETERTAVGGLVTVLLLFTPGFLLHEAPRFPGSFTGTLLGIVAAILMVLLLSYPLIKRLPWLRRHVTANVGMGAVLSFHVYAGALGAVLGILHTGHKFESPLGIMLVTAMLVTILSGFAGRYYLVHLSATLREQKAALDQLRAEYDRVAAALQPVSVTGHFGCWRRQHALIAANPGLQRVVNAIADTEYGMRQREGIRWAFASWMVVHVSAALVMYAALALHIWNGIYFGLRWL